MTCWRDRRPGVAWVLAVAAVLPAALHAGGAASCLRSTRADLLNPLLGPDHSQWLVGAIACIADKKEVDAYLALTSDEAAERFVEDFWKRRNPYPQRPDNEFEETYEKRAEEADRLYRESGLLGRRTARGTIYVLYGEPKKIDHDIPPFAGDPPIEVWIYDKDAPKGLDGRRPERRYRFIKRGDLTEFYDELSAFERKKRRALDPRLRPPNF